MPDDNPLDKPRRFGPGNNPGGRPKGLERRVRELLGPDIDAIILAMRDIAMSPGFKPRDRIAAAKLIMDRGWGQAREVVDVNIDQTQTNVTLDVKAISLGDARKMEALLGRMLGDAAKPGALPPPGITTEAQELLDALERADEPDVIDATATAITIATEATDPDRDHATPNPVPSMLEALDREDATFDQSKEDAT